MFFKTGIYKFNKPVGWTSFDVVNWVRYRSDTKKVGHAGTLDPLATGLLIVAVGREYTKKIDEIVGQEKEYICEVTFGTKTDTYDAEGKITFQKDDVVLTKESLEVLISGFLGEQDQLPPMYSAVKKNGRKLYDLARKGIEVERQPRKISIKEIELLCYEAPRATMRIVCSKGTYIRTLCYDMGEKSGEGAFMSALARTRIGNYILDSEAIFPITTCKEDKK